MEFIKQLRNKKSLVITIVTLLIGLWCFTVNAATSTKATNKTAHNAFVTLSGKVESYTDTPILIGGHINLGDETTDSAFILGGDVHLGGIITQDVAVTGSKVLMSSVVGEHSFILGGNIQTLPKSKFEKHVLIIGGNVIINGQFFNSLTIIGGKVVLAGHVKGNVRVMAGAIDVAPTATIDGTLQYSSPEDIRVANAAVIKGGISKWETLEKDKHVKPKITHWWHLPGLFFNIGLLLIGILIALVFPRFTKNTAAKLINKPWKSLGIGFITLISVPIVAIILLFTVVGIPLSVILLMLYAVALLLAYIFIALGLGMVVRRIFAKEVAPASKWQLILSVTFGIVILYLLRTIPVLGGWIAFFALLFGLGCLILSMIESYEIEETAPILSE